MLSYVVRFQRLLLPSKKMSRDFHRDNHIPFFKNVVLNLNPLWSTQEKYWLLLSVTSLTVLFLSVISLTFLLRKLCMYPYISLVMCEWWITLWTSQKQLTRSLKKEAFAYFLGRTFSSEILCIKYRSEQTPFVSMLHFVILKAWI